MTNPLLTRHSYRPKPGLAFLEGLSLAQARVHEFCGSARRTLALIAARATEGPVFWISPGWTHERLNAQGVLDFINPGRLTLISPPRGDDLLWVMEEILRSGCAPLVVCELPGLPHLTAVRRLHLAAENAAQDRKVSPLGLLLTAGTGGAAGVESRWHMAPAHIGQRQIWQLERRRARMEPVADWHVERHGRDFSLVTAPPPQNC
ncbi:MAG: hypothetical protein QNL16_13645 [Rhodobacterales bacterium]|jgi:protein ImuA|nr:hypothetical protein [Rhodobacter sp.]